MERRRDRRIRSGRFFYLGPSFNNDNLSNGIWVNSKVSVMIDITLIFAILFAISIISIFIFIVTVAFPNIPDINMPGWYTENDVVFVWAGTGFSIGLFIFLSSWYIYYELIFKKKISPLFETNIKSPNIKLSYLDELVRSTLSDIGLNFTRRGPLSLLGRRVIYFVREPGIFVDISNQSYKDVKVFSLGVGPVREDHLDLSLDLMRKFTQRAKKDLFPVVGKLHPHFMTGEEDEVFMVNSRDFGPYSHGRMPMKSDHRDITYDKREYGQGKKGFLMNMLLVLSIAMFFFSGVFGLYAIIFIIGFDVLLILPVALCPIALVFFIKKLVKVIRDEGFFGEKLEKE